jgi:filamentous hemagglutinin
LTAAIANTANCGSFYNKSESMVRDVAGGNLIDNGNKRTAVEVVEKLIKKNGGRVRQNKLFGMF